MVQPVVIGAQQDQVGQLGGAAVFPVPDVVGVQTAGGPAAGNHAAAVAVLQRAAQPPVDHPGRAAGTNGLAVALEPDFAGGVTREVGAFGIRQQRTQMQRRDSLLDVDVHHHRGVLPVRASGRLGVPAGLDQAHERLDGARKRGPLIGVTRAAGLIVLPLGTQGVTMRGQRRVELRGVMMAQADPVAAALFVSGFNDRGLGLRPGLGFGSRFQTHRSAQLVHRRNRGQLRVVLIRSRTGPRGDHPDLIQRQPSLPQARRAAGKLPQPARHRGDRVGMSRRATQLPGHQPRHRPRPGSTPQPITVDLRDDLHDAPINRITLTSQLRQLPEQHLKTLGRTHHHGRRSGRRHNRIITTGYDKFPLPIRCYGSDHGLSGLTANWITRYGERALGSVLCHWLTNTRTSSSVEPGEM